MRSIFAFLVYSLVAGASFVADAEPTSVSTATDLFSQQWPARWITHPGAPINEYGVYLFRKTFELPEKPQRFVVHVTADARYRLWVNGQSVGFGPQRSDSWVWHYDSIDLAPWLHAGENIVAARVVSYGEHAPYATVGVRTAFLLQGDTEVERVLDTGPSWKVWRDDSYSSIPVKLSTYIVVGAGVRIDGLQHPWGWETWTSDELTWNDPRVLDRGTPYGWGADMAHWLRPRRIPPMEEKLERFSKVRRTAGVEVSLDFLDGTAPVTVPGHSKATMLLDHAVETNAFTSLIVSGGKGSRVKLTYAEAMIDQAGHKGQRDEVDGRTIEGIVDEFVADGGERRIFGPLDFRTYRYVQLDIETADESLRIDDVFGRFTGYPFEEKGRFSSDDPALEAIWDVGWRTARLCAFETYMDCPYYEQLQYVGDTRIQALVSLYVSGDDRLMRNAIEQFDRSRIAEGLTQSRYPSVTPQVINTFSLFWVDMVHDYWMHRADEDFVGGRLPGIQAVLAWFERKIDASTGLLGPLDYWTFVDWADEWSFGSNLGVGGEPEGARAGGSSIVSLQLAATSVRSAELHRAYGRGDLASHYEQVARDLREAVKKHCWDDARKMFADSPAKKAFSQHANATAVLAGAIDGSEATELMQRVVSDPKLIQCTIYFRFYLMQAAKRAGLGDEYLRQLGPWRTMLALGLTTFAEKAEPTRSDCHAWSASPVYELLATVAGIEPSSPAFSTVRIAPHLGALQNVDALLPHPAGEIRVKLQRHGNSGITGSITLPAAVTGAFEWNGRSVPLKSGEQSISVP